MIATDLDGTLLSVRTEIPPANVRALRRAMDAGVKLCLCTGRMIEATLPVVDALGGVNAPVCVFNGAMLYDPVGDKILGGTRIPLETARAILRRLEALGAYAQAFPGRNYYFAEPCAWTEVYSTKIGVQGKATGMPLSKWLAEDVFKLLVMGTPEETARLVEELTPEFPDVSFVKSSPNHLEIVLRGVDKGTGLFAACRATGIAPEEVLAFGDEMNDLPLLEAAGTGYAMANGAPGVLRCAKYIAPNNTEAGLARIVNMYLDEGRMGGD